MRLRTAIKICKRVFTYPYDYQAKWQWREHMDIRYNSGQVREALTICRRGKRDWNDRRCRYFPSDSDLDERADIHFFIMKGLAESFGAPQEKLDEWTEEWYKAKGE